MSGKSCVVFAVSIFDRSRLYVLEEFLSNFKKNFYDCDFYIGVNHNSLPEVEETIAQYNLNTSILRSPQHLYCGSDASAYQAALRLLKDSNKSYSLFWFAHTKGAVNNRPNERALYLNELYGERKSIELLFDAYSELGSYGLRGVSRSAGRLDWSTYNCDHFIEICSNTLIGNMKYSHVNWSYIETMYVLNKRSVETFFSLVSDSFFELKIQEPCYFETAFPWMASRCGYFSFVKYDRCFFNEANLGAITKSWMKQNQLSHLEPYLTLQ